MTNTHCLSRGWGEGDKAAAAPGVEVKNEWRYSSVLTYAFVTYTGIILFFTSPEFR